VIPPAPTPPLFLISCCSFLDLHPRFFVAFSYGSIVPACFSPFSPLVCFVFSETKREFHAPPVIRFSS
jgi:hypothetical protein